MAWSVRQLVLSIEPARTLPSDRIFLMLQVLPGACFDSVETFAITIGQVVGDYSHRDGGSGYPVCIGAGDTK